MNTVKQRLENRTSATLSSLSSLAQLNRCGDQYSIDDVHKIETALNEAVEKTIKKLKTKPDLLGFKLGGDAL